MFPAYDEIHRRVLHLPFVRQEYSRHTHDEYVVGLVVDGVQRFEL